MTESLNADTDVQKLWFVVAEQMHDEYKSEGLNSTADFLRTLIDTERAYCAKKGRLSKDVIQG